LDDVVEQALEVVVDLVGTAELLGEVAVVDLDVARFVCDLVGRIPLGFFIRRRHHDLGGREQRALLAVEKLRDHPGVDLELHAHALVGAQGLGRIQQRVHHLVRAHGDAIAGHALDVDVDRPVELGGVPGARLPLLVQREQRFAFEPVFPVEGGLEGGGDVLERPGGGQRNRVLLVVFHGGGSPGLSRAPDSPDIYAEGNAPSRYGMMTQSTT
jgi:hypothetical protein